MAKDGIVGSAPSPRWYLVWRGLAQFLRMLSQLLQQFICELPCGVQKHVSLFSSVTSFCRAENSPASVLYSFCVDLLGLCVNTTF